MEPNDAFALASFLKDGERPAVTDADIVLGKFLAAFGVLLVLVCPFLVKGTTGLPWVLATGAAFAALGCWAMRPRGLTGIRWMTALGALLLLVTQAASGVAGPGKNASALVRRAPADAQWISFGNYFQAIPFLTGQRVVVVAGTCRPWPRSSPGR